MKKELLEFPVSIYGNVEPFNDTLSKARCRIFYKYGNRNGTYVTDEFADELVSTLPYTPIKGIYEYDTKDYSDHGQERSQGRIYGIVPEDNNFAWELHLDEDGVEREYACTDVYLFSALYPEANEIVGKSQSMELYEPTLEYHMAIIKGQKYYVFDHGSFLGLQVLGDNVEPCFEGASFYSLQSSIEEAIQKIKEYSNLGGKSEMPNIKFKLSDSQKYDYIWTLLNPEYTEEGGWVCSYTICDIFDDYALAFNYETNGYERVYYEKDDETDSVTLKDKVQVFVIDVTEKEKETLDTLRVLNGDTYELVNENLSNAEKNANDCAEFSTKIEELNSTITTLNTEAENVQAKVEELETQYTAATEQNSALLEEVEELKNYKKGVETEQKESVISEYSDKLSEEVIEAYREKFDEYTVEDLDMHLAYELKKSGSSIVDFTQKSGRIPKDQPLTGVNGILERYVK